MLFRNRHRVALLLVAVFLVALPALAGDRDEARRIVVVDDQGHEQTITLNDNQIELVVTTEDGTEVHAFDMDALAPVIDEAMGTALVGLEEAMAALREADLEIHVDDDMLTIEHGDQVRAVNVTMLARTIDEALSGFFANLDGTRHRHRVAATDDLDLETEALREEIAALQDELRQLQAELQRSR